MGSIGENIKQYRKEKNISQKELSKKTDIHVSQLSRYEKNKSVPTLDNLLKISLALNVSVYQLDESLLSLDDMIHVDNKELIEQLYLIIDIANGLIEKIKDTTDIQ